MRLFGQFGRPERRITLKVRLAGGTVDCETYEAAVVEEKELPVRINLLQIFGDNQNGTRIEPAQAANHRRVANVYLRQIGVFLAFDENRRTFPNGAREVVRTDVGVFKATVDRALSFQVDPSDRSGRNALLINDNPKVAQIQYIGSLVTRQLGVSAYRPSNSSAPIASETFRVVVEEKAERHTMEVYRERLNPAGRDAWGVLIENATGGRPPSDLDFGKIVAHEICHLLGVKHRNFDDNTDNFTPKSLPVDKNLMDSVDLSQGNLFPDFAEDLDLIQLNAARTSAAFPAQVGR